MEYEKLYTLQRSNSEVSPDLAIDSPSKPPTKTAVIIGNLSVTKFSGILVDYKQILYHSFEQAAYHLKRPRLGYENTPEIIIGILDHNNLESIMDFGDFLKKDIRLSLIPFILIDNSESNKSLEYPISGTDDILKNNISQEDFNNKIALLKKFKLLKHRAAKQTRVQTDNVPTDRQFLYKLDSIFRRIMDIIISAVALIILSPIFLLIAILIKIDSRGPIFYTSYRAGSGYRIFKFIKFRTMVVEADHKLSTLIAQNQYGTTDKDGQVFIKISNDPRITRFGRFLRNTSLDELPQLINVLKSDMSIVGNRPLPLYEAKVLTSDLHIERFNAPAGITGLWQISKRGQKKMSIEERIALDIHYARHNSSADYLQIILKTPMALFQKDNV